MKDVDIIFGKTLKKYRKNKNLTQEELADLSYINIKTISNLENGQIDIDLDKLESISNVLNVDLVEEYLYLILNDSEQINNIIKNLNSRDRYSGSSQFDEINILTKIENTSNRKIIKQKAKKLNLLFRSIEIKDNMNKKKELIIKALNIDNNFDFVNLSSNAYDIIDYRLLMNYAFCVKNLNERLRFFKFIEQSRVDNDNLNSILYHNMAVTYYILYKSYLALYYINKAISSNKHNPVSPIMLYQKSLILYDLSLDYKKYVRLTLKTSRKSSYKLYYTLLEKYILTAKDDKNFIISYT